MSYMSMVNCRGPNTKFYKLSQGLVISFSIRNRIDLQTFNPHHLSHKAAMDWCAPRRSRHQPEEGVCLSWSHNRYGGRRLSSTKLWHCKWQCNHHAKVSTACWLAIYVRNGGTVILRGLFSTLIEKLFLDFFKGFGI